MLLIDLETNFENFLQITTLKKKKKKKKKTGDKIKVLLINLKNNDFTISQ